MIYASAQMQSVVSLAVTVAASDVPILITGANGAGKEKLAEIIQANSRRKDRAFVKVNVGALPDQLLEAELFGAEAGAFTGAAKMRIGRFEAAAGGTLFLDEIGNLSPSGQAKLLRVLQTGEFERLGSSVTRKVDVRIVSATNVDLSRAIADGTFREDLFFRLNVIELQIPPIADRPDDILPLAEHFLATLPRQDGVTAAQPRRARPRRSLAARVAGERSGAPESDSAGDARLRRQPDHAGAPRAGRRRTSHHGPSERAPKPRRVRRGVSETNLPARLPESGSDPADPDRAVVEDALMKAGGVVSKAAAEMGISRQALYRRMERAGVVLERRPRL